MLSTLAHFSGALRRFLSFRAIPNLLTPVLRKLGIMDGLTLTQTVLNIGINKIRPPFASGNTVLKNYGTAGLNLPKFAGIDALSGSLKATTQDLL